jgi:hypothetical protein
MALNMDAIGKPIGPMKRDYTWKDAVFMHWGSVRDFPNSTIAMKKICGSSPAFPSR